MRQTSIPFTYRISVIGSSHLAIAVAEHNCDDSILALLQG